MEDNLEESPGVNPEEVVKQTVITSHQEENILYQEIEAPKFESANLIEETPKHLVRVYPKSQSVYKKTDVVIQCRDEGYRRSNPWSVLRWPILVVTIPSEHQSFLRLHW